MTPQLGQHYLSFHSDAKEIDTRVLISALSEKLNGLMDDAYERGYAIRYVTIKEFVSTDEYLLRICFSEHPLGHPYPMF